jgi:hypothetical protein
MANETTKNTEPIEQDIVLKSIIVTLTGKLSELKVISHSYSAVYFSYKGTPALRIIIMKDLSSTVRNIEFIFEGNETAKELQKFVKGGGLRQKGPVDHNLYVDLKLSFLSYTEREPTEMHTIEDLYKDIEVPATKEEKEEMKINEANLDIPQGN